MNTATNTEADAKANLCCDCANAAPNNTAVRILLTINWWQAIKYAPFICTHSESVGIFKTNGQKPDYSSADNVATYDFSADNATKVLVGLQRSVGMSVSSFGSEDAEATTSLTDIEA